MPLRRLLEVDAHPQAAEAEWDLHFADQWLSSSISKLSTPGIVFAIATAC